MAKDGRRHVKVRTWFEPRRSFVIAQMSMGLPLSMRLPKLDFEAYRLNTYVHQY